MRFLADMGVSLVVVRWLRENGQDAVHLTEQNLQCLTDELIFAKAHSEKRIVLTFDLDFGEIAALSGNNTVSVIVFRLRNARAGHVISRLSTLLEKSGDTLGKGSVVIVEESRFRVRHLPIGG
ncbi:MAG: DUF5615 family PIN-like protein [Nitrospinae bacterium]|nr:DUF5615 family PIN-like protein [Nitrospinota bacterium]